VGEDRKVAEIKEQSEYKVNFQNLKGVRDVSLQRIGWTPEVDGEAEQVAFIKRVLGE
jgi:hypothetical protein